MAQEIIQSQTITQTKIPVFPGFFCYIYDKRHIFTQKTIIMDKTSAILNIVGLAILLVIIMVKMDPTLMIILLCVAGVCILAAAIKTFSNIFRRRR